MSKYTQKLPSAFSETLRSTEQWTFSARGWYAFTANGCVHWMFYQTKVCRCVCNDIVWKTLQSAARVPHCRWYLEGRGKSQSPCFWDQAFQPLLKEIFYREYDAPWETRSITKPPRSESDTGSLNSQDRVQGWPRDIQSDPFAEIDIPQAGSPPSHRPYIGNMESTGMAAERMFCRFCRIKIGQSALCLL